MCGLVSSSCFHAAQAQQSQTHNAHNDAAVLRLLDCGLIGVMWPAERVIMGQRVSKRIRQQLCMHCPRVLMQCHNPSKVEGAVSTELMCRDLSAFKHNGVQISVSFQGSYLLARMFLHGISAALDTGWTGDVVTMRLRDCWMWDDLSPRITHTLTALQTLHLSAGKISDDGAAQIAEMIANGGAILRELNLSSNLIGPAGAAALAGAIQHCASLTALDLHRNMLGPQGTEQIARAARLAGSVEQLRVGWNEVGWSGDAGVLADWQELPAGGLAEELSGCQRLRDLDVGGNGLRNGGMQMVAAGIGQCSRLRSLSVEENEMWVSGLRHLLVPLQGMSMLEALNLANNNLWQSGAVLLGESMHFWPNLREFDLSGNNIGAEGAVELGRGLCGCVRLASLKLGGNNIGGHEKRALESVCRVSSLTHLDLHGNWIENDGMQCVVDTVSACCPGLEVLRLSANGVGSAGVQVLAGNTQLMWRLRDLDLSYNEIGDSGADALADALVSMSVEHDDAAAATRPTPRHLAGREGSVRAAVSRRSGLERVVVLGIPSEAERVLVSAGERSGCEVKTRSAPKHPQTDPQAQAQPLLQAHR